MTLDVVEFRHGGGDYHSAAELLQVEGAMLLGDASTSGEGQLSAISRLSDQLDRLCDAFRAALRARDVQCLRLMAPPLLSYCDICSNFRLMRELAGELSQLAEELADVELRFHACYWLGSAVRRLGSKTEAAGYLERAVGYATELHQPLFEARARRTMAQCVVYSDSTVARRMLVQAVDLAQSLNDKCELGLALNQLGILDFEQGYYAEARAELTRSIDLLDEVGNLESKSRSQVNLAMLELRAGRHSEAQALLEKALEIKRQLHDLRGQATCLANLGSVASDLKDYTAAQAHYRAGLDIAERIGDRNLHASLLMNLGMVAREQQDYVLAATYLSVALQFHREIGNRLSQAVALRFMAILSLLQGNTTEAADYIKEALEIYISLGARRELALSAGMAGILLVRQGDVHRGVALIQAAREHERTEGFRYEHDVSALLENAQMEAMQSSAESGIRSRVAAASPPQLEQMPLPQLAAYALDTLRERFRYDV